MSKRLHLTRPAGLIALFVGGIGLLALSTGLLGLSTLPGASSDVQAQNVAQPFSASADAYVYSTSRRTTTRQHRSFASTLHRRQPATYASTSRICRDW